MAEQQSVQYTSALEKLNISINSALLSNEEIITLSQFANSPWPQVENNGFLPNVLLQPKIVNNPNSPSANLKGPITDWTGQQIQFSPLSLKTEDKINISKELPKNNQQLSEKPYSHRDTLLAFGDSRQDYFKFGLQTIDGIGTIENPENGSSTLRLSQDYETPYELNDPVMFGFDIIFDSQTSPLLNGSLRDFIVNYSGVSEIESKYAVYEEFRNQFAKFFRTTSTMGISASQIQMTNTTTNPANLDSPSGIYLPGKKNYLGYYIKKISGLDYLIEQNKGDEIKYLPNYKKDFITIDMFEDVSLSVGTLAHLYKTLYWSRPNGKMLIPENLLRFNCKIIVSECRNFTRVKKSVQTGNVLAIKDNVSRWIYTLNECQFYFDKLPLPNEVDLGDQGPSIYDKFSLNFDFKYSSVKLERFVPPSSSKNSNYFGRYVGIDGGSLWKVGNKESRDSRGTTGSVDLSNPKFRTVGMDTTYAYYPSLRENGVEKPFILAVQGVNKKTTDEFKTESSDNSNQVSTTPPTVTQTETTQNASTQTIEDLKKQSEQNSTDLSNQKKAEDAAAIKNVKQVQFGALSKKMQEQSLAKIKQPVATPLSQLVKNKSIPINPTNFFDKMNSLNSEKDLLKKFNVSSILGETGESLTKKINDLSSETMKFGKLPSLNDVSSKFSAAKTEATSRFFDVRGDLKSSLTEGKNFFNNSLDTNIIDINTINEKINTSTNKVGNLIKGLANDEIEGAKQNLSFSPQLESISKNFSTAKESSVGAFFDIRKQLSSEPGNDSTSLNIRANLLNTTLDKIYGNITPQSKAPQSNTPQATSFFDLRNQLKDFVGGSLGDKLTGE
jgi:hypothetical protein